MTEFKLNAVNIPSPNAHLVEYYREQLAFVEELMAELPAAPVPNQDEADDWDAPEDPTEVKRRKLNKLRFYFDGKLKDAESYTSYIS